MQLLQDTVNKQHILAEDSFGNTLIPSLSNLYVAHYSDCIVLAVFSSLEKKLLTYKITHSIENIEEKEHWFQESFNKIIHLSFTTEYEITPELFATSIYQQHDGINGMTIAYNTNVKGHSRHYLTTLMAYHLSKNLSHQIYLFRTDEKYTILLMNGATCLLGNTYECKNEHEVLYFILNSLQISDILPSETSLLLDYSLLNDKALVNFISPHLLITAFLNYNFEGINHKIPQLSEKLFACYAATLCE